jgi:flagellar biosynthesis/type III secretory pathway protein FliH
VALTTLGNIDATLQTRWKRVTSVLGRASTLAAGAE